MNKEVWLVAGILLVLVVLSFPVDALGITTMYYSGNSLTLKPGETKTISLGLSNMAGDSQNLTVIANITKGAEIAQLVEKDKQYSLPFGTNNNIGVNVVINAPIGDPIGKEYEVEVTITTVTSGVGGGVILGSSIGTTIPVTIVSPTGETIPPKTFNTWWVILILLIVIIIIIIILSRKKKKKR
ncbi:MAG: hypothetical protein NTX24_05215 [Candidatus Pacearchaeota archaeon]|nr:hypothetical protein [Candidatus Pacearchaeota archaeon]